MQAVLFLGCAYMSGCRQNSNHSASGSPLPAYR